MSSTPAKDFRAHAEFHARESPSGIGAAVVHSSFDDDEHVWECIVDRRSRVALRPASWASDLPPFPNISTEDVEQGIERFAATLPARDRIRHLLNANPLHIRHRRDGERLSVLSIRPGRAAQISGGGEIPRDLAEIQRNRPNANPAPPTAIRITPVVCRLIHPVRTVTAVLQDRSHGDQEQARTDRHGDCSRPTGPRDNRPRAAAARPAA